MQDLMVSWDLRIQPSALTEKPVSSGSGKNKQ
jgi:hypothetical protein